MAIDPWLDSTPQQITYTIMADVGGVYGWIRYGSAASTALGRYCGDAGCGWFGEHRVSEATEQALAAWQRRFEAALAAAPHCFDWAAFHAEGITLARRVKQEFSTRAHVIYRKPVQDPCHRADERLEVSLDGALVRLPNRAQLDLLPLRLLVRRMISGGQSGVDRAALDWAINHRLEHGGWCPRGRRAEDGPIAMRYQLVETEAASYAERTKRNVRESDATLILNTGVLEGGSLLTQRIAAGAGKPCLVAHLDAPDRAAELRRILEWLGGNAFLSLNVAGPREHSRPGIYAMTYAFLQQLDRLEVAGGVLGNLPA
ncbi:MAG TPA: putative molybdenum carrier protein [Burkholderiaceae bacterium]|nr:putative molybdenum carrier protein [Burkholderiaceae bacterium]